MYFWLVDYGCFSETTCWYLEYSMNMNIHMHIFKLMVAEALMNCIDVARGVHHLCLFPA